MNEVDIVVIGAGQAGLATSHALIDSGLSHVVLDAGDAAGGAWSHFYDSLTLFSPARFCELPGLRMPGDRGRYPTRDETVAYLRRYAEHFELPVRTRTRVLAVRPARVGLWEVELDTGETLSTRAVVAATGTFECPHRPKLRGQDHYGGRLMHVADYRRPDDLAGQRIVVVGAGNSAVQVAVELAAVADVTLAARGPVLLRPQRPLGIDLHYWVAWSGLDRLPLGRRAGSSVGVLDEGRYAAAIAAGKPNRRGMFFGLTPDGVEWWSGPSERVDTVILATGYRPALDYLPAAAFAEDGWPAHRRGVSTTLPRLGYVGLPGQTGLASATLRGVGPDAYHVVRRIRRQLSTHATPASLDRPLVEAMT
jgi:putative flavoprotein involved in K+ transport